MPSGPESTRAAAPAETEVVRYRRPSWNLPGLIGAVLGALACGAGALNHPLWTAPALACAAGAGVFAIRLITETPFPKAFLEISREGVRVWPDDDRPARFIRWEILRGIHRVEDGGQLHFTLLNSDWRVPLPAGIAEPDALPSRILALRPPDIPFARLHDADDALDAAFGFRIPPGGRIFHFEHHHDGTARWDLQLPAGAMEALRSTRLRCSAWYPLPPDMRFAVGSGKPARDGIPDAAVYAIGEGHGHERTPVLIHDRHARRLVCMLVRAMG